MKFLLLVVLATLSLAQSQCPSNCAICLNSVYVCNKWKPNYDLSHYSDIRTINSDAFINAGNAITFDISTNEIDTLEAGGFNGLVNLRTLNLSHNSISTLPDDIFTPMISLNTLDLSYNSITHFNPKAFKGLTNLTKLYINDNLMTTITDMQFSEFLSYVPSLQNITISGNGWHCSCNITGVQSLMSSYHVDDVGNVICQTPSILTGTLVNEVNPLTQPECNYLIPSPSYSSTMSSLPSSIISLAPSYFIPLLSSTDDDMLESSSFEFDFISTSYIDDDDFITSSLFTPSLSVELPSITLTSTSSPSPSPSPSSSSLSFISSSPFTSSLQTSSIPISTTSLSSRSNLPSSSSSSSSFLPSPTPLLCPTHTTITDVGSIAWPSTPIDSSSYQSCPYGPHNSKALRSCVLSTSNVPIWGPVVDGGCFTANNRLSLILTQGIDSSNAAELSIELSHLPFDFLSADGLNNYIDIVRSLIDLRSSNINDLVNVLSSVDLLLSSSAVSTLTPQSMERLQSIISSALLNAIHANNTQLILQFSNLLIGGKHLNTNQTLVEVDAANDGELFFVDKFKNATSQIEIEIYTKDLQGNNIQITIYNDSDLFIRKCIRDGSACDRRVVTPVVVTTTDTPITSDQSVDVTFDSLPTNNDSTSLMCAMWNTTDDEWDTSDCETELILRIVKCHCNSLGSVAIIQGPTNNVSVPSPPSATPTGYSLPVVVIFYICCGLSVLLHIPVIIALMIISIKCDDPTKDMQCLLNQGLAQVILMVLMMASFRIDDVNWLCLTFGSLLHYALLVSFLWLLIRPIVLLVGYIWKGLHKKNWFIFPFSLLAWSLPIIPVTIYGVSGYYGIEIVIYHCWLESLSFPNYMTYLCGVIIILILLTLSVTTIILIFSRKSTPNELYWILLDVLIVTTLFSSMVYLMFGSGWSTNDITLAFTSGMALLVGTYYMTVNGLVRSKVRRRLCCSGEDKKVDNGGRTTPSTQTSASVDGPMGGGLRYGRGNSRQSTSRPSHYPRHQVNPINTDEYIGFHLGYPIPLYTEVVDGKRVRKKRGFLSDEMGSSEV